MFPAKCVVLTVFICTSSVLFFFTREALIPISATEFKAFEDIFSAFTTLRNLFH